MEKMLYKGAQRTEGEIDEMIREEGLTRIYSVEGIPTEAIFADKDEAFAYARKAYTDKTIDPEYVSVTLRRIASKDEIEEGSEWWPDVEYWTPEDFCSITRYEIMRGSQEIVLSGRGLFADWSQKDILDAWYRSGNTDERVVESYDTLEEAQKAFEQAKKTCSTYLSQGSVHKLLECDIITLERNTYTVDEDGEEWFDQGEMLDDYAEPINLRPQEEEEE